MIISSDQNKIGNEVRATFEASLLLKTLSGSQRTQALEVWRDLVLAESLTLLAANQQDLDAAKTANTKEISKSNFERLKLDNSKIKAIAAGIQDLAKHPDLLGQVLTRTKLDENLILENVRVPLGVIAIVFESRPDVIPQILSLALRSGNAVLLKGGREAHKSNHAFMALTAKLKSLCAFLPDNWVRYYEAREEFNQLLEFDDLISLVIPRGSNQLVQSVMGATRIPVLGHADGVCHLYVHAEADIPMAVALACDGKVQYPSACNSIETLLIDQIVAAKFLPTVVKALRALNVKLKGCEKSRALDSSIEPTQDWHHEYGDLTLAIKIVANADEAINHINKFGSHHTDAIVTRNSQVANAFRARVDSASVMVNASTRFADGYRFGLGAEVGISTSKLHARGPVGVEGLLTTQFQLTGAGQVVSDYVGDGAKPFVHAQLPTK